jgi:YfiH family protein
MGISQKENCYFIENSLFKDVLAGFTTIALSGSLPDDLQNCLCSVDNNFNISYLDQKHSRQVMIIDKPGFYPGDGLFTKDTNHIIAVRTADCLPIFFASDELGVVGIIHMGWRSAQKGILDNIPYRLSSFKVIAGVGLDNCCFEVGEEFLGYSRLAPFVVTKKKLFLDPVAFCKKTLIEKGLKEENFTHLGICSFCQGENKFFSYRRDKTNQRTISFIARLRI